MAMVIRQRVLPMETFVASLRSCKMVGGASEGSCGCKTLSGTSGGVSGRQGVLPHGKTLTTHSMYTYL